MSGSAELRAQIAGEIRAWQSDVLALVGALANEGGLSREDFGAIQIRPDFSIVELPSDMSRDVLDKLRDTRISGTLIEIKPDRRGVSPRHDGAARKPRY